MSSSPWWEAPAAGSRSGPPPWLPTDYTEQLLVTPASNGAANAAYTATLGPVPAGQLWAVTRSTVALRYPPALPADPTLAVPVVRHYLDTATNGVVISGTNTGDYDEADFPYPGLWVPESRSLLAVWGPAFGQTQSIQNGGVGTWYVQYAVLKRGG